MKLNNFWKLIIAIGVSQLAGVVGSLFTASSISTWYSTLIKPALNPPSWVFGPVWITLYALMGIALFLIWKRYSLIRANKRMIQTWQWAIVAFFIQLFLNAIWSIIFFGLQNPGLALINIILLWLAILWTMVVFYKISRPAMYLLIPYILWVSFATFLNFAIWQLN